MSAPKSVTKINKDGITYTSNVDKSEYYIHELCRAALRDTAKFVKREFRISFYKHYRHLSGDGGRATKAVVYASKSTTSPRVELGLKKGKVDGFYAYYQETEAHKQPKLQLLQKSVEDNVSKIREIQSQYLSGLNKDDTQIEAMIDEEEITIDDE